MSSDNGNDIIGAFFGAGFGIYSFFRGFRLLRNKRIVENTPTSKCRSVAMGPVEVAGRAVGEQTVPSPIGQIPCFCSHLLIERWQRSGKSHKWVKVHEEKIGIPFQIEDETGRVKVDPSEAELDIPCELEYSTASGLKPVLRLTLERMQRAHSFSGAIPQRFQSFCLAHGVGFHGKMRFFERNLSPDDSAYVLGVADELPGVQDEQQRILIRKGKHHPWFFIAEASEKQVLSRLGRHTWLHIFGGAALCLACLGYLLYRFGMLR